MSLTQIRKELLKEKTKNNKLEEEAAMLWLQENVIPLNEGIDKDTLAKLISVIQKFDEKLSKYSDKLPTIANIISNAENELNQVIIGNYRSKKKTAELLQSLTSVYNHLSDILKNRIKLVIASPLFKNAREFEDLPIKAVDGLDYEMAYSAFRQAVKPSTVQLKLWGKIIPKSQYEQMCKDFCDLSYKQLTELCNGVPKVPVVMPAAEPTEDESTQPMGMAAEAGAMAGGAVVGAPVQPSLQTETPMSAVVAENHLQEQLDAKTQQALNQAGATIANLTRSIKGKGFEKTEPHLLQLLKAIRTETQTGKPGNAFKQANQVISIFNAIKSTVPTLNQVFADGDFDDEDINYVQNMLTKASEKAANQANSGGGIFANISNFLKGAVQPFPGLSAKDIVEDLMDNVRQFTASSNQPLTEQEQQPQQANSPVQPPPQKATQKQVLNAKQFFANLNKALTTGLAANAGPQQQQSPQAQSQKQTMPPTQQQEPSETEQPQDPALLIKALAKALGKDEGKLISDMMNAGIFGKNQISPQKAKK